MEQSQNLTITVSSSILFRGVNIRKKILDKLFLVIGVVTVFAMGIVASTMTLTFIAINYDWLGYLGRWFVKLSVPSK